MRRRRAFLGRPGRILSGRPRQTLRRAFQLMESGQHSEAAGLFEPLARSALDLGLTRRAAYLLLQAGRARFLSNQPVIGTSLVKEGLQIPANAGQWQAVRGLGTGIIGELDRMGLPEQAQQLSVWISELTQGKPAMPAQPVTRQAPLPAVCPQCGAAVRPGEVEWIDRRTAECAYCGSILPNG